MMKWRNARRFMAICDLRLSYLDKLPILQTAGFSGDGETRQLQSTKLSAILAEVSVDEGFVQLL